MTQKASTYPALVERFADAPGVVVDDAGRIRFPIDLAGYVEKTSSARMLRTRCLPLRLPTRAIGQVRGCTEAFSWQAGLAIMLSQGVKRGGCHATGLGKTGAGLMALDVAGVDRALVVTKTAGRESWVRDVARFGSRRPGILVGEGDSASSRSATKRLNGYLDVYRGRGVDCVAAPTLNELHDRDLVIVGWEVLAERRWQLLEDERGWNQLILDEAHYAKGKGRNSRRAAAAVALSKEVGDGRTWLLTATPVINRIDDLWTQFVCISQKEWPREDYWKFMTRHCHAVDGEYGVRLFGPPDHDEGECRQCREATKELRARFNFWFDVKTRDCLRNMLPPITRSIVLVPFDPSVERTGPPSDHEAAIARAADIKLPYVAEAAAEVLIQRGKVVVAGIRRAWAPVQLRAILREIKQPSVRSRLWHRIVLGGDPAHSVATAEEYMRTPGPALIIGTMQALGESMDLQDTDRAIAAALPWRPGDVVQFEGRCYRPGQSRPVEYLYPIADGTIDVPIRNYVLEKFKSIESVGSGTEGEGSFLDSHKPLSESEVLQALNNWLVEAAARYAEGHGLVANE